MCPLSAFMYAGMYVDNTVFLNVYVFYTVWIQQWDLLRCGGVGYYRLGDAYHCPPVLTALLVPNVILVVPQPRVQLPWIHSAVAYMCSLCFHACVPCSQVTGERVCVHLHTVAAAILVGCACFHDWPTREHLSKCRVFSICSWGHTPPDWVTSV